MSFDQLSVSDDGKNFQFDNGKAHKLKLEAGIYTTGFNGMTGSRWFSKVPDIQTDKLISLSGSVVEQVMEDVEFFLSAGCRQAFADYQLLHRRGILLYGPPGTGKTSCIIQIARGFVETHKGIVLLNPSPALVGLYIKDYHQFDPGRVFLVIFEELDGLLPQRETEILNLLDGQSSVENVLYVATTNYFDRIPDRIKNRPSRFARQIEVGTPPLPVREAFLRARILPKHQEGLDIAKLAADTDGLTIDHLKDLIVSMFCFGKTADEAVEILRKMNGLAAKNSKTVLTVETKTTISKQVEKEEEPKEDPSAN